MEAQGTGVEDIGDLPVGGGVLPLGPGVPGGVVDGHPRLGVEAQHVEADPCPVVLHAPGLHLHPPGDQVGALVDGGHPVEDVVAGGLDVVGHLVFKGEHPLGVQVPGASDEVALVGVLPRQLEADEVAAVVEVLPVHPVIADGVPAGGLHLADLPPLLGGHEFRAEVGIRHPAPAQGIQGGVVLKGLGVPLLLVGEGGLVSVQFHPGVVPLEVGDAHRPQVHLRLEQPGTAGQGQAGRQQQSQQQGLQALFHGRLLSFPPRPRPVPKGRPGTGKPRYLAVINAWGRAVAVNPWTT